MHTLSLDVVRHAEQDGLIGNLFIPKGISIICDSAAMQRDPLIWPRPDDFIPERWEHLNKAQQEAWMPFGKGSRVVFFFFFPLPLGPTRTQSLFLLQICLGQSFSLLEMKAVLVLVLQRFSVAPVPGSVPRLILTPTLYQTNAMPLILSHRAKNTEK